MERIPYEILQLIATWLLPRYQCRLALASKWCYQYLYTDLLRWHARKDAIAAPRYKYGKNDDEDLSLLEFNKTLILYDRCDEWLYISDLTNNRLKFIKGNPDAYTKYTNMNKHDGMALVYHTISKSNILKGCYKYMDKTILILYLASRHPLLSMSPRLLDRIMRLLNKTDKKNFIESSIYLEEFLF